MKLDKGNYTYVTALVSNCQLSKKTQKPEVSVYFGLNKIGKAKIVEAHPLTVNLQVDTPVELNGPYFSLIPGNYTTQNGVIINIMTLKLVEHAETENTPIIQNVEEMTEKKEAEVAKIAQPTAEAPVVTTVSTKKKAKKSKKA